jgi:predicted AAA+ superfamily ATPase
MQRLIFGSYPELYLLKDADEKAKYLKEILNAYLLKDILAFENIKNSSVLFNLLKLVAYQIQNEVSFNELAKNLQISKHTVDKYLDLLNKVFVLFRLQGYSRNLRKEVVKSSKWYFYDNGIRNAIIANFNPLNMRNDIGALWENYVITERMKFREYNNVIANQYFWRTYDQQEIDLIEEREGKLFAFDMKWKQDKIKPPAGFIKTYPDSKFSVITQQNYFNFLTNKD